ncbi:hypothetical protein Halha_2362 [Halobacteroides halobius DSM 5150]|uniref:DUF5723 domain-containing protein n=1 Tax=Halobacteroides halobius (strain ATCC 35273 / DSM 5150 / MD-1) TaxID=748449 RepID=L0KB43_HALHC|nr:hypothetical protein [Halobacteroides halobius]AGB42236.1 hypothetical protein Halha_2362 [Halobacteroides halobius DSM 5150]
MLKNKFISLVVVMVLLIAVTSITLANSSAKMIGLGDNFVTVTGADALYGNPAAVNANADVFTLELGTDMKIWNNLLKNDYISSAEKKDLLSSIKGEGFFVGVTGRNGAKLIIGPVATSLDLKAEGVVRFNPDIARLVLQGNKIGKTYQFDDSTGSGAIYADGAVNLSVTGPEDIWDVEDLYIGFTYHQLAGTIFKVTGTGDLKVDYAADGGPKATSNGQFTVKYNPMETASDMAMGSALDFGTYARLNDTYTVGFSVMNIGAMTADSTRYIKYKYNYDSQTTDKTLQKTEEGRSTQDLKWRLPATYRVGGQMSYSEDITFFTDYSYTTYYTGEESYQDHQIAAATQLTWLSFLPLRTGLNYSTLENDFDWSAGLGLYLGPLQADLGVSDLTGLFNQTKDLRSGLTFKIEF